MAPLYIIIVLKVIKKMRFGTTIHYNGAKSDKKDEIWHHYILKIRFKCFPLLAEKKT